MDKEKRLKEIGRRIRDLRLRHTGYPSGKHLTQEALAHELNVSQSAVNKWESSGLLTIEHLLSVAEFFNADPADFLAHEQNEAYAIMTTLPDVTGVELELDKGWLTIWFDQPETRNALTDELVDGVRKTLEAVRDDRDVRGITLRGKHGVFCAGGNLKQFKASFQGGGSDGGGSRENTIEMSKGAAVLFDLINEAPQVVIAIIEGAAMAGGFGMACCADVVICEANAKFAMTETAIGISPAQIAPFVIQKLGYATARRLMLTAARFNGEGAHELGFADFVAGDVDSLNAIEQQIRSQVLKCAPGAIAETKSLIIALPDMTRDEAIQAAAENFTGRLLSDEGREGVASFLEKRKPVWAQS